MASREKAACRAEGAAGDVDVCQVAREDGHPSPTVLEEGKCAARALGGLIAREDALPTGQRAVTPSSQVRPSQPGATPSRSPPRGPTSKCHRAGGSDLCILSGTGWSSQTQSAPHTL